MASSERLRPRDYRAAFRIAGEARELGDDSDAWRAHVVAATRAMIGATVALTLDMHDFLPGVVPKWIAPIDLGWETDRERRVFLDYLASDQPAVDPAALGWTERAARRRFVTAARRDMVEDRDWYASPLVSEGRRSSRIDDMLGSCFGLGPPGHVQGFLFYRPWGAPGFRPRDRKLVRLIHLELVRALGDATPAAVLGLPPRLRPVLGALLRGQTAKQVAGALGLSIHTVDGYVKELYRHFGVGSRAQLLLRRIAVHRPGRLALPPGL